MYIKHLILSFLVEYNMYLFGKIRNIIFFIIVNILLVKIVLRYTYYLISHWAR